MFIIHTDGGSRGNPGPAAIGVVIYKDDQEVDSFKQHIGVTTNNVAEYLALLKGIKLAQNHTQGPITVRMDSELIIKQMLGEYKVKQPHLVPLYQNVKTEELLFETVTYEHIPREQNARADQLVNEALDA